MGQAVQLKGLEYINLYGIPAGFWSGDEWSVMSLIKFRDDGILGSSKEDPVLGDGTAANDKGFHLGLRNQVISHTFILKGFWASKKNFNSNLPFGKAALTFCLHACLSYLSHFNIVTSLVPCHAHQALKWAQKLNINLLWTTWLLRVSLSPVVVMDKKNVFQTITKSCVKTSVIIWKYCSLMCNLLWSHVN